ncbi:MAG: carbohydrate kinase family protein [Candidatus Aenigmatarchaeota archaeon]
MFDAVCIGHIVYDTRSFVEEFSKPDKMSFVKGTITHSIGGSATNVACNLSKLGMKPALIGKIGYDDHGQYLLEQLKLYGVESKYVKITTEKPTGVCMIIVDKRGEPLMFEMVGANEPLLKTDISKEAIEDSAHLHMSGTTLETLSYVAKIGKKMNKTVSFDPGRSKSQEGFKKLYPVLKNVDVLIVNKVEIMRIAEIWDFKKALNFLRKKLKKLTIIVKCGKENTLVFSRNGNFSVSTVKVKVVDTIGAGDAFTAGFLHKFLKGNDIEECVKFANACGALKVTREGATGLPFKDEVYSFYKKVSKEIIVKAIQWY